MGAIEVDLGQRDQSGRTVRFYSEWLVDPKDEKRTSEEGYDAGIYCGVPCTKRGEIAVYTAHVNDRFDATLERATPPLRRSEKRDIPKTSSK